jgi:23S rRNA (adenine2503-C2)-methyltransferase
MKKRHFLDYTPSEIEKIMCEWGESAFRARQVVEWVYVKKIDSFERAANLPKPLRERLDAEFVISTLTIAKKEASRRDGTVRYNFTTADNFGIAAVFLPKKERHSVCISTQVGCAMECAFCVTGSMKFKRNLTRGEMLEQIIRIERDSGQKISGVLLMGMGEPLLNYDNVVKAIDAILDFRQLGIGRRHVTLSTVGIVPEIRKLAEQKAGVRLALSLHAVDPKVRRKLLPRVPFSAEEILEAGLYYSRTNRARLTVEYTLVAGLNDTLPAVQKFVELITEHAKPKDNIQINLIPCNGATVHRWNSPSVETIQRFQRYLDKHGILSTVREPKGADIGAGCGQLGV